ncbi:MAG: DUF3426 domain-containing protein [Betaproteobacteria bacterium]|jgi:predicted Zn finger-like uncharacterized protein|nr:DUF3426 domain-containing protein [Betaproteobacteria bacterium]
MTLITRCPSCGTAFRVRDQQLEARDGRVRCGRCSVVFDARESLAEHLDVGEPDSRPSDHPEIFEPVSTPFPEPTRESAAGPARGRPSVPLADQGSVPLQDRGSIPLQDHGSVPLQDHGSIPLQDRGSVPLQDRGSIPPEDRGSIPLQDGGSIPLRDRGSVPLPDEEPYEDDLEYSEAEGDEYGFGPQRKRRARYATIVWGLASLALLLIFGAQLIYAFRSDIAARSPDARRWLGLACERFGCDLPLPGHADLVTIEVSEMHPEPDMPGILSLTAILRNRAAFAQRQPWIELTLTDARDRALARRVLAPADYLGERIEFERGLAPGTEQSLRLLLDTAGIQPTGYRLLLYYP